MNKVMHGLIVAFCAFVCWCMRGMLTLVSNVMLRVSEHPPAFTQFCVGLRPLFVLLPIVAAGYGLYVGIRQTDPRINLFNHEWTLMNTNNGGRSTKSGPVGVLDTLSGMLDELKRLGHLCPLVFIRGSSFCCGLSRGFGRKHRAANSARAVMGTQPR